VTGRGEAHRVALDIGRQRAARDPEMADAIAEPIDDRPSASRVFDVQPVTRTADQRSIPRIETLPPSRTPSAGSRPRDGHGHRHGRPGRPSRRGWSPGVPRLASAAQTLDAPNRPTTSSAGNRMARNRAE
jgi:hypothetical protein